MSIHYIWKQFFDWIEVWALLIPLPFVLKKKGIPAYLVPVKIYVIAAFVLNLAILLIWKRLKLEKIGLNITGWPESNNVIYNVHSIIRLLLFSWFFIALKQHFMHRVKKILPILFILFVLINFTAFEAFYDYYKFSSILLSTEAAILLFYCLQYFIFLMLEDRVTPLKKQPGFWVATGLSIFVAVSFIVFLFFNYLFENDQVLAIHLWDVHNVGLLILCVAIARAFYEKTE